MAEAECSSYFQESQLILNGVLDILWLFPTSNIKQGSIQKIWKAEARNRKFKKKSGQKNASEPQKPFFS